MVKHGAIVERFGLNIVTSRRKFCNVRYNWKKDTSLTLGRSRKISSNDNQQLFGDNVEPSFIKNSNLTPPLKGFE